MPNILPSKLKQIFVLNSQGMNISQIAKKTHSSRHTVRDYLTGKKIIPARGERYVDAAPVPYALSLQPQPMQQQPIQQQQMQQPIQQQPIQQQQQQQMQQPIQQQPIQQQQQQPIQQQQRETPFRFPREREETVGGVPISVYLGREPEPEKYRSPNRFPPDSPRFYTVANKSRIDVENAARRDEDKQHKERVKELAGLSQQLIQNKQQENKNSMVKSLGRQVDDLIQNQKLDDERELFNIELSKQKKLRDEEDKIAVDKFVAEKKERKDHNVFLPVKKNIGINEEVWDKAGEADLALIQYEDERQSNGMIEDILLSGLKHLVPQIPNIWKIFKSKKPNDNGNNGFKKVTLIGIPDAVVLK